MNIYLQTNQNKRISEIERQMNGAKKGRIDELEARIEGIDGRKKPIEMISIPNDVAERFAYNPSMCNVNEVLSAIQKALEV